MSRPRCDNSIFNDYNITIKNNVITYVTPDRTYTKPFNLTYYDFIHQIKSIKQEKPYYDAIKEGYRDKDIEFGSIPFMSFAFYYTVFYYGRVPSFSEFKNKYFKLFCKESGDMVIFKDCFKDKYSFPKKAIEGRLFRAFYSYYRELELLTYLSSISGFSAEYDFHKDRDGVDITVTRNNHVVELASYLNSKNGSEFKHRKNTIRHDAEKMKTVIDVKAAFPRESNQMMIVNHVYLHSKENMKTLSQTILEKTN